MWGRFGLVVKLTSTKYRLTAHLTRFNGRLFERHNEDELLNGRFCV